MEMAPIQDQYDMLRRYLPRSAIKDTERDDLATLRRTWFALTDVAEDKNDELAAKQLGFKKKLVRDVQAFYGDVIQFRSDWVAEDLDKTKAEIELLEKLYGLYQDVIDASETWKGMVWDEAARQSKWMACARRARSSSSDARRCRRSSKRGARSSSWRRR